MIAGHGNARSIQLAGKVQDDGSGELKEVSDAVDLNNNKVDADALILEVTGKLHKHPQQHTGRKRQ